MTNSNRYNTSCTKYSPIYELTRGNIVESVHYGSVAIVDIHGNLFSWYGDPNVVSFLRSTAKPFQLIPFLEHGGKEFFDLDSREIAIMCGSHSGTDEHVSVIQQIQNKTGVRESDLKCGIHEPFDDLTAKRMHSRKEKITSNRHNCSGKHTGMLAFTISKKRSGKPLDRDLQYIDPLHPVQQEILNTFSEMSDIPVENVGVGIDGCSAPNFAVPLRNTALAFARLCDPIVGVVTPDERIDACRLITSAMMNHPEMVSGPGRFDTRLMEIARERIVSKGGAEAFQGLGLVPGALNTGSPAIGIAIKISDGDSRNQVCNAVTLEVLRQIGVLTDEELSNLSDFGPEYTLHNWRGTIVGEARPEFKLQYLHK